MDNNARVDVFNQEGKSSLHLAAESGSVEVSEELLKRKAYVNSKTKTGWTSLHFAAMKGFTTLVECLIRKYKATVDSLTMVNEKIYFHFQFQVKLDRCCRIINSLLTKPAELPVTYI